jgi:hypothetical protein
LALGILIVGVATGLVAFSSRRIVVRCCPEAMRGLAVYVATLLLVGAAQIVAAGLALGYAGRLSTRNLVLLHLAVALAASRLPSGKAEAASLRSLLRAAWQGLGAWTRTEKALGAGLLGILAVTAVTGLLAEPLTHDAL